MPSRARRLPQATRLSLTSSQTVGVTLQQFVARVPQPPPELAGALAPLNASDIIATYYFGGHAPIGIDDGRTVFEWGKRQDQLMWQVYLSTPSGESINARKAGRPLPLLRFLAVDRALGQSNGTTRGRVVFNGLTCFNDKYCGRGLFTWLNAREEVVFRRWGAAELQLEASCEALAKGSWFPFGYMLDPWIRECAEAEWDAYQRQKSVQNVQPLPLLWNSWDSSFRERFSARESVPMFKALL